MNTETAVDTAAKEITQAVDKGFDFIDALKVVFMTYGINILIGIALLVIGIYISKKVRLFSKRVMRKSNIDPSAIGFISQLIYFMLVIIVGIAALGKMGINTNSFVAAIGALGLAIGLSLQNNLSNFASGILILIFRPFKVGDFIEASGVSGTVKEIQIMTTYLETIDKKTIIIPNSKLTSENVINYSYSAERRIPLTIEISYESDYKKAIAILKGIFEEEVDILKDPPYTVELKEFGASAVKLYALPAVKNENYWPVYYRVMSKVKDRFDENNIEIPYPQRVVYIKKEV